MDFIRKKWGVPIRDIWFTNTHEAVDFSFINIAYNFYKPIVDERGIILKKWQSQTLVSDISKTPEEILANFKSRLRNKIRRATREGITVKVFESREILKNNIISEFDAAYMEMYYDKGQKGKSIAHRLYGIAKVGKLVISIAYLPDGTIAAYHSYVIGEKIARLLHTVSVFREEPEKKMMIGWANRLLHFKDMCSLRERGVSFYDWGGVSRDKKMENITRFKEEFNGQEHKTFYSVIIRG
ncbi:hypothetical protein [Selenomonas ruminis]|uniref:hypothetical protein n=1 Tax=Selenomonas ruminis TaxID=2593411 RepID=UPI0011ECBDDC|nr:hypothetical protein [Selenomonas sp. mPRGC5]